MLLFCINIYFNTTVFFKVYITYKHKQSHKNSLIQSETINDLQPQITRYFFPFLHQPDAQLHIFI